MSTNSASAAGAPRWSIFCAVIDNFGDIGVCWRLARQLQVEHGIHVDLWVNDWAALGRFLCAQNPSLRWIDDNNATDRAEPAQAGAAQNNTAASLTVQGVTLLQWRKPWPGIEVLTQRVACSERVIEAFGCELPDAVKQAMAAREQPLLWLNLEYLSAESWVRGCHALPSPQNLSPLLRKHFFFPGFELRTGGLLREAGLIEQHERWQAAAPGGRRQLLRAAGLEAIAQKNFALWVSLFSYESTSLPGWLQALAEGNEPVLCLVPQGRSLRSIERFLEPDGSAPGLVPGDIQRRGALTIAILPFSSQPDYDRLLSLCDFNLIRGEDSFVRAQWAAKPFMWHIYPQDDGVHIGKLNAFAGLYLAGLQPVVADAWLSFALGWNLGEDCRELWHYLRPQLSDMHTHARRWQQKLTDMPDLATNLVFFDQRATAGNQSTP